MLIDTTEKVYLTLNFQDPSLQSFEIPFANLKILKSQQILTKQNNFVFLNDSNQIIFCKLFKSNQEGGPNPNKAVLKEDIKDLNICSSGRDFSFSDNIGSKMVIDLTLQFNDSKENVVDFSVNSLGNIILVCFKNGNCRFMDIDILKSLYDKQQPEYLVKGGVQSLTRLPCDVLSRTTGVIASNSFRKVSNFKISYYQQERERDKENDKQKFAEECIEGSLDVYRHNIISQ